MRGAGPHEQRWRGEYRCARGGRTNALDAERAVGARRARCVRGRGQGKEGGDTGKQRVRARRYARPLGAAPARVPVQARVVSTPVVLYPGLQAHVDDAAALVLLGGQAVHDAEPATLNVLAGHAEVEEQQGRVNAGPRMRPQVSFCTILHQVQGHLHCPVPVQERVAATPVVE